MAADLREQLQRSLGDAYRIERELGGGGMSRVFVAVETALDRRVVVKILLPELAAGVSIDRFRREIQLAAQLQHPHIVPLLAAGDAAGLPWFTMPYVTGESLRARIMRDGELPIAESVRILRDVASALAYAHAQGVVHRDIKPDNVLLSHGVAVVTDFGVAKALTISSAEVAVTRGGGITSMGVSLGTPAYMAPEQASADPGMDHRVDLYAFGITAYEMLTGQPPFIGRTPQAILGAQVVALPEPVGARRPGLPPLLVAMVMKCLEKRPADRPQHAGDLIAMLDMMTTPSGVTVPFHAPTVVVRPPPRLRIAQVLRRSGPAIALVAGAAGAAGVVWLSRAERRDAPVRGTAAVPAPPVPAAAPDPSPAVIVDSAGRDTAPRRAPAPAVTAPAPRPRPREPGPIRMSPDEAALLTRMRDEAHRTRARAAAAGVDPATLAHGDTTMARADSLARQGYTTRAAARLSSAVAIWAEAADRAAAVRDSAATAAVPPPAPQPAPKPALPTPPPRAAPPARPAHDAAQEIGVLFEAYAAAIEARSLPAIRKVYPSIQPAQARDWEQFFEAVEEITVELRIIRLDVTEGAGEASLAGVYVFTDPSTRRERREDVSFVARVRRDAGGWRIESVR